MLLLDSSNHAVHELEGVAPNVSWVTVYVLRTMVRNHNIGALKCALHTSNVLVSTYIGKWIGTILGSADRKFKCCSHNSLRHDTQHKLALSKTSLSWLCLQCIISSIIMSAS